MIPSTKREIAGLQLPPVTVFRTSVVEKQLLLKIAKADAEAFGVLYAHYHRKVYFIAWKLLKVEAESEDVVQEIFAKIWVNREKLTEIEHFNSWLNTIIRNHLYNCLRKKANEESIIHEVFGGVSLQQEIAVDNVERHELQALLHRGMNSLPAQQKKVFQLSRMEGLKHSEIAETMGISIETVKKHIMLSVGRIRNYLKEKIS